MEIRILGPLEATDGTITLDLGGFRQRALLARLAVASNRVVAVDELLDELWGPELPSGAKQALQAQVSRIRRALGDANRLAARASGYLLHLAPNELDASQFEVLLEKARTAKAKGDLECAVREWAEAEACWRGAALAEFLDYPFAQSEAARLNELRLAAIEAHVQVELEVGRHDDVVADLEGLVEAHPYRERLWSHLILALYRSRRQADALRAFQRLRKVLGEDLGISPSPELVELERAVLLQDPELAWVRPQERARRARRSVESLVSLPASSEPALPSAAWAPRTKHLRPVSGPHVVLDEHLIEWLSGAVTSTRLTLICAQAGSGKTTLAAAVADALADMPVAWIRLDHGDDSLSSVLYLLAVGLRSVVPGGCPAFVELLGGQLPAASDPCRSIGVLVNDMVAADPPAFLVVLDDLDRITSPAVVEALDYLLDNAPPALHMLATARVKPPLSLSRLRAGGQLTDVRADDLRFTPEQTEELLNHRLQLGLPRQEVARVGNIAGGWVSAVCLLGRSLEQGSVRWSQGPIGRQADSTALYEYLADEILANETEDLRRFLVDVSILDELTPALCDAVTGRHDSAAILAELHRRNHFLIVAVDTDTETYRLQDLFSHFLSRRLAEDPPSRRKELHRRAAAAVDQPSRRFEHLLAASDHLDAAELVEGAGRSAYPRTVALRQVTAWIERLDPDVRNARPWLRLLAGVSAAQRGHMSTAVEELQAALGPLEAANDYAGQWIATHHLHAATYNPKYFSQLSALERRPEFDKLAPAVRAEHHLSFAYGALFAGQWDEVARRLGEAVRLATATADVGAIESLALNVSPILLPVDGAVALIKSYVDWTERTFPDPSPVVRLGILHQQAMTAFFEGRLEDAVTAAESAGDLPERLGGVPYLRHVFHWVLTETSFSRGDFDGAVALIEDRQRKASLTDLDRDLIEWPRAVLARVFRAQGRAADVARLVDELHTSAALAIPQVFPLLRTSVQAQAMWAAGDLAGTEEMLRQGLALDEATRFTPFITSLRLDLALVLAQRGRTAQALKELSDVLSRAHAWSAIGMVVQAGQEIVPLLEFARDEGLAHPAAVAALTALRRSERS